MLFPIYRNNEVLTYVKPDSSSELIQKLMEHDYVSLSFTLSNYMEFAVGDYIMCNNTKYELLDLPNENTAPKNNEYTCKFCGTIHTLNHASVLFQKNFNYSLTGNAGFFLQFIVDNLNRDLGGFVVGSYEEVEPKTLTFSNMKGLDAIKYICNEFGVEFYLEGKTLHFTKNTTNSGLIFKVGRYDGLYELARTKVENANIVTRLWAYGSVDNLSPDYQCPLQEKRLHFENPDLDNDSRMEQNTDMFGLREHIEVFDIRPERTGLVTSLGITNRSFIDNTMDFDMEAYKLPGLKPQLNVLTGLLAGRTFDCSYNHNTHTFTVDYKEENGTTFPNDVLTFEVGDKYTLFNISQPIEYITQARSRLQQAAQEYLSKYSIPQCVYELTPYPPHIRRNNIVFRVGVYHTIIDSKFNINGLLRVISLQQNIINTAEYEITVGEILPSGILTSIKNKVINQSSTINNAINNVYTKTETNTQIEINGGVEWE